MSRNQHNPKYVLYVRVSSDRQDVDNSIAAQEAAAQRYVEAHGGTIIRTYRDEAKSGKVAQRPGFQQMIQDAEDPLRTFDGILVWKLSRFARNRKISVTYKANLAELGIRVISISENTSDSPSGHMLEGIIETVDEFHSANMAADIKEGMRTSTERGFYLARSAPMGYKKIHVKDGAKFRPKLELDRPWNNIPRRVFQLALLDYGFKAIVQTLAEEGFRTPSGALPNFNLVRRILKNPHYTGFTFWDYRNQNDNYAKSHEKAHEEIISPEDWDTVQRKIASRHRRVMHPRTAAAPHLFNDLGICANCNHKIAIKGSGNNRNLYFICNTRSKHTKKACDLPRYPLSVNDPILMESILQHVLDQTNLSRLIRLVRATDADDPTDLEEKLNVIESRFEHLDSRETQLLIALELNTFSSEKIAERMDLVPLPDRFVRI